ncbi:unnamed protein product [Lactuca virosa]|uniref:Uncharacterized protein n=1 Tax=Lactuca virosa TaxID=75947 RepID=A0AAU9P7Y2_9ASTR|nr:unnamed protein product [Lactuca virosa]
MYAFASSSYLKPQERISASEDEIDWVKTQIEMNGLHMHDNVLCKGINPRTRAQQLHDLIQYKGISHYEQEEEAKNHTAFPCPERDELSLMAAFRYELPAQGLLYKHPFILKGEDMEFVRFGSGFMYDLVYASAVFLHMPDKLVWVGLERLVGRLKPLDGRLFVSHNVKFVETM